GLAEIGGRIEQRWPQPRFEELHREIVMMGDGSSVPPLRMLAASGHQIQKRKSFGIKACQDPAAQTNMPAQQPLDQIEDCEDISLHIQISGDKRLAQRGLRWPQQLLDSLLPAKYQREYRLPGRSRVPCPQGKADRERRTGIAAKQF